MPNQDKLTILFLAANPVDTERLQLDEEYHAIDEELLSTEYRDSFDLRSFWAVRYGDVQQLLLRYKPHIVHFSGHGSSAGEIILKNDDGSQYHVPPDRLASLFGILKDNIRCVVLNACFSQLQAEGIAASIDCVVGMKRAVPDKSAIEFAAGFYLGLGFGRSVKTAFDLGCNRSGWAGETVVQRHLTTAPEVLVAAADTIPRLIALRTDPAQIVLVNAMEVVPPPAPLLPTPAPPSGSALPNWQQAGIELIKIPAGKFLYGDDKKPVYLDEFWISRTPITNRQYQVFVTVTGYKPPKHWGGSRVHPSKQNHPVVNVTWNDAQEFCAWAGVFLPTEQQWEKAARGTDGREYPWGNEPPTAELCNFDNNVGDTTPVGRHSPQGDSPYGLVDMTGNVWEWCEDTYDGDTSRRVVRGGAFFNNRQDVRCAARHRNNPINVSGYLGFRVVTP